MNLICPVCGYALMREQTRYCCENGHSFDRSKYGYVNLLQKQSRRRRGDDAQMVRARRDFLETGCYQPLLDAVTAVLLAEKPEQIADIGCGEGWYACNAVQAMKRTGLHPELTGIDISPEALRYAAVRARAAGLDADFAAASVSRLPIRQGSCGCLLNLFAPCEPGEFARVLRPGGLLIRAVPLERHLWELKAAVYEKLYENKPVLTPPEGFDAIGTERICYTFRAEGEVLQNLFAMTPYVHKTSKTDAERIAALDGLTVSAQFGLLVCKSRRI